MPLDTHTPDGGPDIELLIAAALLAGEEMLGRPLDAREAALLRKRFLESRL